MGMLRHGGGWSCLKKIDSEKVEWENFGGPQARTKRGERVVGEGRHSGSENKKKKKKNASCNSFVQKSLHPYIWALLFPKLWLGICWWESEEMGAKCERNTTSKLQGHEKVRIKNYLLCLKLSESWRASGFYSCVRAFDPASYNGPALTDGNRGFKWFQSPPPPSFSDHPIWGGKYQRQKL